MKEYDYEKDSFHFKSVSLKYFKPNLLKKKPYRNPEKSAWIYQTYIYIITFFVH